MTVAEEDVRNNESTLTKWDSGVVWYIMVALVISPLFGTGSVIRLEETVFKLTESESDTTFRESLEFSPVLSQFVQLGSIIENAIMV